MKTKIKVESLEDVEPLKDNERVTLDTGDYKIGRHGYVFHMILGEWVNSAKKPDELRQQVRQMRLAAKRRLDTKIVQA
jgi:hypothetical protein